VAAAVAVDMEAAATRPPMQNCIFIE